MVRVGKVDKYRHTCTHYSFLTKTNNDLINFNLKNVKFR